MLLAETRPRDCVRTYGHHLSGAHLASFCRYKLRQCSVGVVITHGRRRDIGLVGFVAVMVMVKIGAVETVMCCQERLKQRISLMPNKRQEW